MTRVSIVIDNYNYEQYVGRAIESALAQTWLDTEVIVVDDGSTDGSRDVIKSYHSKVKTLLQENRGQNHACNAGFALSTGDVVMFLDADDAIDAITVERVVDAFSAQPELSRVQWPLRVVDARGTPSGRLVPHPETMFSGDLREHLLRFRNHAWPPTSGSAYSREALAKVMPVPDNFRIGTDLYLAELTALRGPVRSFLTPGGDYRIHGTNQWSGGDVEAANIRQRIEWTVQNHENVRKACAELGIDCPINPTSALDVAFICQRLASLRLDPRAHPIEGDERVRLMLRGLHAAIAHPHHSWQHKLKRVGWIVGVALGTYKQAHALIARFYFRKRN